MEPKKIIISILLLTLVMGTANGQAATGKREVRSTPPQSTTQPQSSAQPQPAPTAGAKCALGAKKAVLATALVTGIGCAIDLFVTGGAMCTTYLSTALANAPTAAAAGCTLGALGSGDGASAGIASAPHIQLEP